MGPGRKRWRAASPSLSAWLPGNRARTWAKAVPARAGALSGNPSQPWASAVPGNLAQERRNGAVAASLQGGGGSWRRCNGRREGGSGPTAAPGSGRPGLGRLPGNVGQAFALRVRRPPPRAGGGTAKPYAFMRVRIPGPLRGEGGLSSPFSGFLVPRCNEGCNATLHLKGLEPFLPRGEQGRELVRGENEPKLSRILTKKQHNKKGCWALWGGWRLVAGVLGRFRVPSTALSGTVAQLGSFNRPQHAGQAPPGRLPGALRPAPARPLQRYGRRGRRPGRGRDRRVGDRAAAAVPGSRSKTCAWHLPTPPPRAGGGSPPLPALLGGGGGPILTKSEKNVQNRSWFVWPWVAF